MIDCESIAQYFSRYIKAYHKEFKRFVTPQPEGAGYPNLICSPYLYAKELNIYIARDGVVVLVHKRSVPTEFIRNSPIMHLSRPILATNRKILSGKLPKPINSFNFDIDEKTKLKVRQFDTLLNRLIKIVTLDNIYYSPDYESDFWTPFIIINFEFKSELSEQEYDYIEIYPHVEKAAWDIRSIWAKAHLDLRRDFLNAIINDNKEA